MSEVQESQPMPPMTIEQLIDADVANAANYPDATGEMPQLNPKMVSMVWGYINNELKKGDIEAFPDAAKATADDLLGVLSLAALVTNNALKKSPLAKDFMTSEALIPLLCVREERKSPQHDYKLKAISANARFRYYYPEDSYSRDMNGRVVSEQAASVFMQLSRFVRSCFENDAFTQEAWDRIDGTNHSSSPSPERKAEDREMPPPQPTVLPEKATPLLEELSPNAEMYVRATHAFTRLLHLDVDQFRALGEILDPDNEPPRFGRFGEKKRQEVAELMRGRFIGLLIGDSLDSGELTRNERRRVDSLFAEVNPQSVFMQLTVQRKMGRDPRLALREIFSGLRKREVQLYESIKNSTVRKEE